MAKDKKRDLPGIAGLLKGGPSDLSTNYKKYLYGPNDLSDEDPTEWSYVQKGTTKVYFQETDRGLYFFIADKELNTVNAISELITLVRNEYASRD